MKKKNLVGIIIVFSMCIISCFTVFAKQYIKNGQWVIEHKIDQNNEKNGWYKIDNDWYYYRKDKKVCDEIISSNNKFYYLDYDGKLCSKRGTIMEECNTGMKCIVTEDLSLSFYKKN